eukprot:793048_1
MADKLNQQISVHRDSDDQADQSEPLISVVEYDSASSHDDDIALDNGSITRRQRCHCLKLIGNKLNKWDKTLSSYIFRASPGKCVDVLMAFPCLAFSYFGFPLWIVLYVIIMQSYLYALCVLVSIVVTQIMKRCIKRNRPKKDDLGHRWFYLEFEDVSPEHSFPSGDTSQSAVFAVTLGYSLNPIYFFGLLFTPIVCICYAFFINIITRLSPWKNSFFFFFFEKTFLGFRYFYMKL